MSAETQTAEWGVDSEHGRLLDVLLCPPDNFHWLETSAITRATLASGRRFEPETARRQHAEMVAAYEHASVRCIVRPAATPVSTNVATLTTIGSCGDGALPAPTSETKG